MLPSSEFGSMWSHLQDTMQLYMLLACVLWSLGSHSAPTEIGSASLYDNHTAVCAEIQRELSAENTKYNGTFTKPQNTTEEHCYGQFTKDFIATLEELMNYNQKDIHIQKIYKNMKILTRICSKLKPTESPKNCITERSDFSKFKKALHDVVMYIEGWTSCQRMRDSLWDPILSVKPCVYG